MSSTTRTCCRSGYAVKGYAHSCKLTTSKGNSKPRDIGGASVQLSHLSAIQPPPRIPQSTSSAHQSSLHVNVDEQLPVIGEHFLSSDQLQLLYEQHQQHPANDQQLSPTKQRLTSSTQRIPPSEQRLSPSVRHVPLPPPPPPVHSCPKHMTLYCRALTKRSISQNFQNVFFCIIHISLTFSILCQKILAENRLQSSFLGSIKTLYPIFRVGFDNQNTLSNVRVYNTSNLADNLYF